MVAKNVEAGVAQGIQTAVATLVLHGIEYSVSSLLAGLKSGYHHFYPSEEQIMEQLNHQADIVKNGPKLISSLDPNQCIEAESAEIVREIRDACAADLNDKIRVIHALQVRELFRKYKLDQRSYRSTLPQNYAATTSENQSQSLNPTPSL